MPPIPRPYFDHDDSDAEPAGAAAGAAGHLDAEGDGDGDDDFDAPDDRADADVDEDDDELALGTAEGAATVWCPYCGEASEVAVDPGGGDVQEYVEDCPVCCRPWRVTVTYDADGNAAVWARTDDE